MTEMKGSPRGGKIPVEAPKDQRRRTSRYRSPRAQSRCPTSESEGQTRFADDHFPAANGALKVLRVS